MNNYRILISIFILFMAGIFLWISSDLIKSNQSIDTSNGASIAEPGIEAQQAGEKSLLLDGKEAKKPEGMPQADWERALREHTIKKSANRNIIFYGKLIDQHGVPVEGVSLDLEIISYQDSFIDYLNTGREQVVKEISMTTDANGMFSVENQKGVTLKIENMTKEGYVTKSNWGVKYSFFYNNLSSSSDSSAYHSADKDRPVIYELWKKGKTEPLIMTSAKLTIDPTEGINEVYYRMESKGKPSPQPMPDWDIMVTGKNIHSPDLKEQQYDYWEVTLTAGEGGGLMLTDSPHANLAPEGGYKKSLTIKSTEQMDPRDRPVRLAYYRGKDGEKYAAFRLALNFGTVKTGNWIEISLAELRINPNGSRNLEFDKAKQIK